MPRSDRSSWTFSLKLQVGNLLTFRLKVQAVCERFLHSQPKAGTGHKMQTVSFFQRYIVRDISLTKDVSLARYFWEGSLTH